MKFSISILVTLGLSQLAFAADGADSAMSAGGWNRTDESSIRGLYVVGGVEAPFPDEDATALTAALEQPGVDGMVLVVGWDDVEPSRGHYAWEQAGENPLDKWMSMAMARHKKALRPT